MILVTVGTHHQPFDRLVEAAEALARSGHGVWLQRGPSTVPAPHVDRDAPMWSPRALSEAMADAAVVVCHGGPGTILEAWQAATPTIVVPRDPARGEHVDDHQLLFAGLLGGRATVLRDVAALPGAVRDPVPPPDAADLDAAAARFCEGFAVVADRAVARARRRATVPRRRGRKGSNRR